MTEITLYSKASCPPCMATKHWMTKEGVEFNVVMVDQDPEALSYVKSLGYSATPVVVRKVDDEVVDHWTGFSEKKIKTLKG